MAGRAGDVGEFELIAHYFAPLGTCPRLATTDRIPLGIGDDAALLNGATGKQLAISVDTLTDRTQGTALQSQRSCRDGRNAAGLYAGPHAPCRR
jgi:thiamine monophosphate kinase